jgi:hypothetical protein
MIYKDVQLDQIKNYIEGVLQYWNEYKPLNEYEQGIETGLKKVLNHIKILERMERE